MLANMLRHVKNRNRTKTASKAGRCERRTAVWVACPIRHRSRENRRSPSYRLALSSIRDSRPGF